MGDVKAIMTDPKVLKTIRWWRQRRAWGLDWLDQDAVINRAVHRTATGHRPLQHVNSSFTRFLLWETNRELAKQRTRFARGGQVEQDELEEAAARVPAERDPDGACERVWRWAERYLSSDERAAITAVYRDGLSQEAFAASVGVSPEVVSARIRSAVARLRVVAQDGGWVTNPEGDE